MREERRKHASIVRTLQEKLRSSGIEAPEVDTTNETEDVPRGPSSSLSHLFESDINSLSNNILN